ncbi:MAG: ribbon-helix-helix domain-containing protein [Granulosicoccaceae bacterium]
MCQMFAGQPQSNYDYQSRSIRLNGLSTSVRLEQKFWEILGRMAQAEKISTPLFISTLYSEVITLHGEAKNFTSLLRCTCLIYLQKRMSTHSIDELPAASIAS